MQQTIVKHVLKRGGVMLNDKLKMQGENANKIDISLNIFISYSTQHTSNMLYETFRMRTKAQVLIEFFS